MGAFSVNRRDNSKLKGIVQEANGLKRVLWIEAKRKIEDSKITEDELYDYLMNEGILTNNPVMDSVLILDENYNFTLRKGYFFTSKFYANQFSHEVYSDKKTFKAKVYDS